MWKVRTFQKSTKTHPNRQELCVFCCCLLLSLFRHCYWWPWPLTKVPLASGKKCLRDCLFILPFLPVFCVPPPFVGEHMEAKKSRFVQGVYKVNLGEKARKLRSPWSRTIQCSTSLLAVMFPLNKHEITHNQHISMEPHKETIELDQLIRYTYISHTNSVHGLVSNYRLTYRAYISLFPTVAFSPWDHRTAWSIRHWSPVRQHQKKSINPFTDA